MVSWIRAAIAGCSLPDWRCSVPPRSLGRAVGDRLLGLGHPPCRAAASGTPGQGQPSQGESLGAPPCGHPAAPRRQRSGRARLAGSADQAHPGADPRLAEVNNPNLKAIAAQVDQAQNNLRAQIALWYPTLNISANALPSYTGGQQYSQNSANLFNPSGLTTTNRWFYGANVQAQWALINPQRVPAIAAARDSFEKAKDAYLVTLRDLRLQVD
ncbi:MAG: hypothetical protein EBZ51_04310, partial [Synechococcaceae bacterium WB9_2_112]|nr:hypothetical protein [Synechococcaceae bacterium WB9_2_112]